MIMEEMKKTQFFKVEPEKTLQVSDIIKQVYEALTDKGYNPVNQIVGYIMSGDPTYITSHKNARSLIMKVERDELVEEMMKNYIDKEVKVLLEENHMIDGKKYIVGFTDTYVRVAIENEEDKYTTNEIIKVRVKKLFGKDMVIGVAEN